MNDATLFDGLPDPAPRNDAAPAATGAGVKTESSPDILRRIAPPCRRNAPQTSREAARRIAGHAHTLREQVFTFVESCGAHGATDQEIQTALELPSNTGNPRRCELRDMGRIVDSGQKRPTRSGCRAIVWVVAAHAQRQNGGGDAGPA
jgi:hypothetical protein